MRTPDYLVGSSVVLVSVILCGSVQAASVVTGVRANPTVKSDRAAVRTGIQQLNSDRLSHNWSAIGGDLSTVRSAEKTLASDSRSVYKSIVSNSTVKSDWSALGSAQQALSQAIRTFSTDRFTRNTSALAGDKTAVKAARAQVRTDTTALTREVVSVGESVVP
jgi:hypothetical protein